MTFLYQLKDLEGEDSPGFDPPAFGLTAHSKTAAVYLIHAPGDPSQYQHST
jgi:hypothetical protein